MKKKLPQCLLDKQERERATTIAVVTGAVTELMSQGYDTRIRDIMSCTGLSRSVFAKPHVRKVLIEYGIVAPKDIDISEIDVKARRDIEAILAEKAGYIERLRFINEQLTHEIQLLRGEVHLLTHKSLLDETNF